MPTYAYVILAVGWALWFLPFPITGWNRNSPQKSDHRARWGLVLQAAAYVLVWQGHFWTTSPSTLRIALSILFLALATLWSFTSTRALGRHLRFDAALSPDHALVRSGPYRFLRHPIYTSMFCLLLGTGFIIATPIVFVSAILVFLAGTEIRVHVEDKLLASRFGNEFQNYQHTVSAYIPLVR
jgi:protein-S-isoprenylcysteine O-methyltransferase Ste14